MQRCSTAACGNLSLKCERAFWAYSLYLELKAAEFHIVMVLSCLR